MAMTMKSIAAIMCAVYTVLLVWGCSSSSQETHNYSSYDGGFGDDVSFPEASDTYVLQDAITPPDEDVFDAGDAAVGPCVPELDATYEGDVPDLPKLYVSNQISVAGSVNLGSPDGPSITTEIIASRISNTIATGLLPYDPDGVYFFFGSAKTEVDGESGWCYSYCAWHNSEVLSVSATSSALVRYAFVGDVAACPDACAGYELRSDADYMASPFAHELAESATDPDPTLSPDFSTESVGWIDFVGYETADKCAYDYGNAYTQASPDAGSTIYNVQIGARLWLVQQLWSLNSIYADHCSLGISCSPGFDTKDAGAPITSGNERPEIEWPIQYFGGKVLTNPIHLYYLVYGDWSSAPSNTIAVMQELGNNIGGSDWWQTATQYFELVGDSGVPEADSGVPEASTGSKTARRRGIQPTRAQL